MHPQDCFRFLDLPIELRLMVYEHLTLITYRHTCNRMPFNTADDDPTNGRFTSDDFGTGPSVTLLRKSYPIAIIQTCHAIRKEAKSIVAKALRQLEQEPLRIITNLSAFVEDLNYLDNRDKLAVLLQPYLIHAQKLLEHIMRARSVSDRGSHVELALTSSDRVLSGHEVLRALLASWFVVRSVPISWTLFCQGSLPDVDTAPVGAIPGRLFFEAARDINIHEKPLDHDKKSIMEVKELDDKEWAQLCEEWDAL